MNQKIDWIKQPDRLLTCPACGTEGAKLFVLSARRGWSASGMLDLYSCPACQSKFFPDLTTPDYENEGEVDSYLKYYVEVGAGVDQLISHVFAAPLEKGARYLEIGSGFGFGLDFARHACGLDVLGIDPSPFAAAGARILNIPMISGYLKPETDLQGRRFDMAVASEVIEHIDVPGPFLQVIRDRLTPDGILILTTPNSACIKPETGLGALLPALSTGWHYILYSAKGLAKILRDAGFTRVEVLDHGNSLFAAATSGDKPIDLGAQIDRRLFAEYLDRRRKEIATSEIREYRWLAGGLTYRLLRELVNTARYREALALYEEMRERAQQQYGFDIDEPNAPWFAPSPTDKFGPFMLRYPAWLCGAFYLRGILALKDEEPPERAAGYFDMSIHFGNALRAVMQKVGADDGEAEMYVERAHKLRLASVAKIRPKEAAAELERLLATSASSEKARIDFLDSFAQVVALGGLEAANPLTDAVLKILRAPQAATLPLELRVQLHSAAGSVLLNVRQDNAREGGLHFALAERLAGRWLRAGGGVSAQEQLWRARQDRTLAWLLLGQPRRALLVARPAGRSNASAPEDQTIRDGLARLQARARAEVHQIEGLKDINERKRPREAALQFALAERAANKWHAMDRNPVAQNMIWQARQNRVLAWQVMGKAERALLVARRFSAPEFQGAIPADTVRNMAKIVGRVRGMLNLGRLRLGAGR